MSERPWHTTHIALVYLIMLLAVIVASWIASVLELRFSSVFSMYGIRSALSAAGLRYIVANAGSCIAAAPVGSAIMLFMAAGVLHGSGLAGTVAKCIKVGASPRELASLTVAAVSLLLLTVLFILGAALGSNLAVGASPSVLSVPLVRGLPFLIMLVTAVPSIAFGLASGMFQSSTDCVRALAYFSAPLTQLLICMLLSSLLVLTLQYTRIDVLMGIGHSGLAVIKFILYWLPLPFILFFHTAGK